MAIVLLGNEHPAESYRTMLDGDGRETTEVSRAVRDPQGELIFERRKRRLEGGRVTEYHPPDSWPLAEAFTTLVAGDGAWAHHSQASVDERGLPSVYPPAWVECAERPQLAALIADHYACQVGRPKVWSGLDVNLGPDPAQLAADLGTPEVPPPPPPDDEEPIP